MLDTKNCKTKILRTEISVELNIFGQKNVGTKFFGKNVFLTNRLLIKQILSVELSALVIQNLT